MIAASPQWSVEEDQILLDHFPVIGRHGCAAMLPHRTLSAISKRASDVGAKQADQMRGTPEPASHRKWQKIDRTIRGTPITVLANTL